MTGMNLGNHYTYPEALSEKVINKRSLGIKHLSRQSPVNNLDVEFLSDLLLTLTILKKRILFTSPDSFPYVAESLTYYSYAHELSRIVWSFLVMRSSPFGNLTRKLSFRTKDLDHISLIPNVQTKLVSEERQSFLEYIPKETTIWIKDYQQSLDIIDKSFHKVEEQFQSHQGNEW